MKPAMYIVLNKGLGMSTGKAAAQAGHAAVQATFLSLRKPLDIPESRPLWEESNLFRLWNKGGHYAKYIMEARDRDHLVDIERYINDRGFKTALIIDEGHTEVDCLVPTALGVELVDKDDPHVAATFSSLDLYKPDPPKYAILEVPAGATQAHLDIIRRYVEAGRHDLAQQYIKTLNDYLNVKKVGERPQRRWWFSRG